MSVIVASILLSATAASAAEPSSGPLTVMPNQQEGVPHDRPVWKGGHGEFNASTVIGVPVRNDAGVEVGKIDDLVVDPRSGAIRHAVISLGALAHLARNVVVVPWTAVKVQTEVEQIRKAPPHTRVVARVTQAALDRAPRYEPRVAGGGP
jgi:sporulation protein YlmC with PRC-barrel domain